MSNSDPIQVLCPSCAAVNRVPGNRLGDRPKCGKCRKPLITGQPLNGSDRNFQRIIEKSDLPVVIDFWATWCGPCQQFAPVFSQAASEMATRALFVKLDTEANQQTAGRFQIRSIPTLMIFHRGRELTRLSGALPKAQFMQWLNQQLP
ncbi:thioredoxin TrxC [Microbulbifer sp. YPW1]|uniref:thioredoxin TrxC n=1 Tax=Microbulbifer sp. YPW1 TaxID=2745199 RepID=UPI001599BDAA|nr:thioredoxin TrxC [Microbulbifer sp. YPW1]QKX18403.1 thioredoxin TrxC [Microbulbifer sp. YPW1]